MASVEDAKQINIPPDEGRQLEKEYEKIKKELIGEMAQDPPPMPTKPLAVVHGGIRSLISE